MLPNDIFLLIPTAIDVDDVDVWPSLKELKDPELVKLVRQLVSYNIAVEQSGIINIEIGAFRHWKSWASSHQLLVFPAH